jgi:hypothetical protein
VIERIQSLAKLFTELTGYTVRESYLMQCEAREWLEAGFTEDDLRVVVWRIKKAVESERIRQAMLRWSFLIGNPVRFDEELQEARAVNRNRTPKISEREKTLRLTGRVTEITRDPKTAGQVLSEAGAKALEEFKAFRRQLES